MAADVDRDDGPWECDLCEGTVQGMCVACRLKFARWEVRRFCIALEKLGLEYEGVQHSVRELCREFNTAAPLRADYLLVLMNDVVSELGPLVGIKAEAVE